MTTSRRDLLKLGALAGAAAILPACAGQRPANGAELAAAGSTRGAPRRTLRLVHFTDAHIQPEREAVRGVAAAFRHMRASAPGAELVVAGGDMVMDAFDTPRERTQLQWDLWLKASRDECPVPIEYVCGNHDIWGWGKKGSSTTGDEPGWGKKWWMEIAGGRTAPYKAIDRGPWRIILLDTVHAYGDGAYEGRLDEPQFAWLEEQVMSAAAARRHVLVIGHIPIMCVSVVDADGLMLPLGGGIGIGKGAVMMDCHRILRLIHKYGNVRACLSGHIHMTERIDYAGTTFYCNGAVSGGWWRSDAGNKARRAERPRPGEVPGQFRPSRAEPGYAVVDLYDDGTVENRYVPFGWVPVE